MIPVLWPLSYAKMPDDQIALLRLRLDRTGQDRTVEQLLRDPATRSTLQWMPTEPITCHRFPPNDHSNGHASQGQQWHTNPHRGNAVVPDHY